MRFFRYGSSLFCSLVIALGAASARADERHEELTDAVKEIVKITDRGLEPSSLNFEKLDSSVFFVNETRDSLVTLSIDFGKLPAHCASGNMKFENGKMKSIEPIGPRDFAILCFPEEGSYSVTVEGVGKSRLSGTITVHEKHDARQL